MKYTVVLLLVGVVPFWGCESGKKDSIAVAEEVNDQNFDKAAKKEADFVADVIQENYAEIKLAELGNTRSTNKLIQDFAQQSISSSNKILTSLQNFAKRNGIAVPADEGESSKEKINKLSNLDDSDFDKRWCKELESNNKKIARKLEAMFKKSKDEEMKKLISTTLDHLRQNEMKLSMLQSTVEKN